MKKTTMPLSRAIINAYLEEHVQTPRCTEYRAVIRRLSRDEIEQVIDATETEAGARQEAAERDLAENTLESFAAYIEAARRLAWAEVNVAQQIIRRRSQR